MTTESSAVSTPPIPQAQPLISPSLPKRPRSTLLVFAYLFSFLCVLMIGIGSPRYILPFILDIQTRFSTTPPLIYVNGTSYTPFTYFLRLDDRRADVYPLDYIHILTNDNIKELSIRGNIPGLKDITVVNNPIEKLPETIGKLQDLTGLYILNGHLTVLPDSIGDLTNLSDLTLTGNHIKTLPYSIGNLKNLHALNLAYNDLDDLPATIINLTNVEVLDLTGNKFKAFPKYLPPNLRWLIIGKNKIPLNILGTTAIPPIDLIYY